MPSEKEFEEQENKFFALRDTLMKEADKRGITMRILGALAFRTHCPSFKHYEYRAGRLLSDIDFAAYSKEKRKIEEMFIALGYEIDKHAKVLFQGTRYIFYNPQGIHSDIFFDKLEMCHDVNFAGRLEIDYPTISLSDLFFEKVQIVQINEKDLIDTAILFREHAVSPGDKETINSDYISTILSNDWGFWKTTTINLEKISQYVKTADFIEELDKKDIIEKIQLLSKIIDDKPKSFSWKMRARIGEKRKWYRDVEEFER
jgi:hypothetical protein